MGTGYTYKCGCKDPSPIMLGRGMLYANICRETWNDILNGEYGPGWARAARMHPEGGLDCENTLYLCECGHWEVDTRKTMWEKGNADHSKSNLPRNRALKKSRHKCPECGGRMRVAKLEEDTLRCPVCSEVMTDLMPTIKWD
ncbi:MAG: hypothetical protein IJV40_08800 [Oscillospiraceae bacterium]|nr:hypothetical protein [Oscillospiraceae bacterium]